MTFHSSTVSDLPLGSSAYLIIHEIRGSIIGTLSESFLCIKEKQVASFLLVHFHSWLEIEITCLWSIKRQLLYTYWKTYLSLYLEFLF